MAKSQYEILVSLQGLQQFQANIAAVEQSLGIVSSGLNALTFQARQAAIEYDSALSKFNTITTEATGSIQEQVAAFDELVASLQNTLTTTEALNAGYDVLSSGYADLNDVTGILTASQKAALGGFSDIGTVVDATTTLLNVYGSTYSDVVTTTQKANDIAAQAIAVQNLGKITVDTYARSIGVLAPTAKAANVSLTEMNAAIALATSRGIAGETAIRGFRQVLINLIRPTAEAQREAEKLGISLGTAALQSEGYAGVLNKIINVAKTNPGVISKIFTDSDSLNIASILAADAAALESFTKQIGGALQSGVLSSQFEIVAETDAQKQQRLLNQLTEEFRKLGTGVTNTLEPVIELLSALVRIFESLPNPVKEFTGALILSTTAAIGGSLAFARIGVSLQALKQSAAAAGVSVKALAAQTAALGGVVFFALELAKAYENIDRASQQARASVESIEEFLQGIETSGIFSGSVQEATDALSEIEAAEKKFLEDNIQRIKDQQTLVTRLLTPINEVFAFFAEGLAKNVGSVLNLVDELLKRIPGLKPIGTFIENVANNLENFKLPNFEDAAFAGAAGSIERLLEGTTKLRTELENVGFDNLSPEQLDKAIAQVSKSLDDLRKQATSATSQLELSNLKNEEALLQNTLQKLKDRQSAIDANVESTVSLKEQVESAAEAEEKFKDALKSTTDAANALLNQETKLAEAQAKRGEISNLEAIEATIAAEEKAFNTKISFLESELEKVGENAGLRKQVTDEITKLEIENAGKIAELEKNLRAERLDQIKAERDLEIAQIEASGAEEIEIARKVFEAKQRFAEEERAEIEAQLSELAEGSNERIQLETRLAKLTSEIANDRVALLNKEIAALEKSADLEKKRLQLSSDDSPLAIAQAELKAAENRLAKLREISEAEGITSKIREDIESRILDVELQRKEANEKIAELQVEEQVEGLKSQLSISEQILELRKELISAQETALSAENELLSLLSNAIGSISSSQSARLAAYDRECETLEALANFEEQRARKREDEALKDLEIRKDATEAEKARIEQENERRRKARERLAKEREAIDAQREQARLEEALQKAREEADKAEARLLSDRQKSLIIQRELAALGIKAQLDNQGLLTSEEAKLSIELLQLENQKQMNALKQQEQQLELENLKLAQQAIIAEQELLLASGTLNNQESAQAQLRLQLAQNQLRILDQQQANLQEQAQLTNRTLSVQEALLRASSLNPSINTQLQTPQGTSPDQPNKPLPIDDGNLLKVQNEANNLLSNLQSQLSELNQTNQALLSATNRLPAEIARSMPRAVVPK